MSENDQLLEPTDGKAERVAKVRFSREGGLEELVRELYLGSKFVLSFPVDIRLDEDDKELCFSFSTNIGTEPHPGLHFSVSFDLPVMLPEKPKIDEFPEDKYPTPEGGPDLLLGPLTNKELLAKEILEAGGKPDEIITPDMTEEKAKEVLDALKT